MDWLSIVIGVTIIAALGIGLILAAQSPSFVAGLVKIAIEAFIPVALKRKTPEEEKKDHEKLARGQNVGNEKPWGHQKGVDS